MKIDSSRPVSATEILQNSDAKKTDQAKNSDDLGPLAQRRDHSGSYSVRISSDIKDKQDAFNRALQIAKETKPEREDRIETLKARIQSGEYKPNAEQIANGILREAMMERLAESEG